MSIYLFPKTILNKLDKTRKTFFWQGEAQKRNTTWLNGLRFVNIRKGGEGGCGVGGWGEARD
jgi:hypothetical protein